LNTCLKLNQVFKDHFEIRESERMGGINMDTKRGNKEIKRGKERLILILTMRRERERARERCKREGDIIGEGGTKGQRGGERESGRGGG
jgi:hypothetical protein